MKRIAPLAFAALMAAPLPAAAQETEKGLSLMEEGARLFMRGMMKEMEPALDDLRLFGAQIEPGLQAFLAEMGPALVALLEKIDDITAYEAPEMLPNGDIILRRKVPLDPEAETAPDNPAPEDRKDGKEIDL